MDDALANRRLEQVRILHQAGLLRRMTETGELKLLVDNGGLDAFVENLIAPIPPHTVSEI